MSSAAASTANGAANGTSHASNGTANGHVSPLVTLNTISYASIVAEDPKEMERLRESCQYPGFFYLDFQNDDPKGEGKQILNDLAEAYKITEKYISENEPPNKMKDIEIKHDDIHTTSSAPVSLPSSLHSSLPLLTRLSYSLREANVRLTSQLYPSLISSSHNPDFPSDTALDLIYAPTKPLAKDAPDTTHTDGGTLTILCSDSWGIKVEDPETKKWAWVEPKDGCGLVNVGDWFDHESKKVSGDSKGVHSCRHAVSQLGDGMVGRYYVSHYLRPTKRD